MSLAAVNINRMNVHSTILAGRGARRSTAPRGETAATGGGRASAASGGGRTSAGSGGGRASPASGGRRASAASGGDETAATQSKRRRGRPLVDDKRRRILDAALQVFAARGYEGTSVPDVADAAGVGTGTLYHYFRDKEALVNEVYRDAKLRLGAALLDGLPDLDVYRFDQAERWFGELWQRLATFATAEPEAFRFLEMQDHVPYLDAKSREVELSVLAPLWFAGKRLRQQTKAGGAPVDVLIALLWGAFVGLVKASRLGYLKLDARSLAHARDACWRMLGPMTKEG
jgi:AcrR family transcriptional regulator